MGGVGGEGEQAGNGNAQNLMVRTFPVSGVSVAVPFNGCFSDAPNQSGSQPTDSGNHPVPQLLVPALPPSVSGALGTGSALPVELLADSVAVRTWNRAWQL